MVGDYFAHSHILYFLYSRYDRRFGGVEVISDIYEAEYFHVGLRCDLKLVNEEHFVFLNYVHLHW